MVHMLYCANVGVFDGIMLSLLSATKHSSSPITAYIMTMDLRDIRADYLPITDTHIRILNKVIQQENKHNSVILVDATEIFKAKLSNSPNVFTGYTPYTLLRLLACECNLPSKILYVDADTMFSSDISVINDISLDSYELAGVVDYLGKKFIAKDYLNAGVLYLNLDKIRQTKLFEQALILCCTKEMIFPDQDAINELVQYKLLLPCRFNEQHKWKKDTIIQHFSKTIYFFPIFKVINIKQWQIELVQQTLKLNIYNEIYEVFLKYREEYGNGLLKPLKTYQPISPWEQCKINFQEVKGYIAQNGGIFRRS